MDACFALVIQRVARITRQCREGAMMIAFRERGKDLETELCEWLCLHPIAVQKCLNSAPHDWELAKALLAFFLAEAAAGGLGGSVAQRPSHAAKKMFRKIDEHLRPSHKKAVRLQVLLKVLLRREELLRWAQSLEPSYTLLDLLVPACDGGDAWDRFQISLCEPVPIFPGVAIYSQLRFHVCRYVPAGLGDVPYIQVNLLNAGDETKGGTLRAEGGYTFMKLIGPSPFAEFVVERTFYEPHDVQLGLHMPPPFRRAALSEVVRTWTFGESYFYQPGRLADWYGDFLMVLGRALEQTFPRCQLNTLGLLGSVRPIDVFAHVSDPSAEFHWEELPDPLTQVNLT